MGAGKTTIGKQIAKALHREFYDADQEIEKRTGTNIAWIFDVEGEVGFRKREAAIIDHLTQKQGIVLATGGGAILDSQNRQYLISRGTVIYLHATIDQQLERTMRDKGRPLLGNHSERKVILEKLMMIRDPLYRAISEHTISTNKRSILSIVQEVLKVLKNDF